MEGWKDAGFWKTSFGRVWTGQLHMVAENVDMHIRCHDTRNTSPTGRIRLCAFGQKVDGDRSGPSKIQSLPLVRVYLW